MRKLVNRIESFMLVLRLETKRSVEWYIARMAIYSIGSGKVFFLLLLATRSDDETCIFATPEGGTRGIHLVFRTRNVGDSRWKLRMRGRINECPNTFKQMHFPTVTWEVDAFRRHCESFRRVSFAKRMTKLTDRFYFGISFARLWNCV